MSTNSTLIKAPNRKEKLTLRFLVILGLISFVNFFYWFLSPEFIEYKLLYWLLMGPLTFDSLRIIYIWYHYWDISVPEKPKLTKKLTVDVFTTFFPGEPYDMVKGTLLAIQRMKYPHTTYLCDEANDAHLRDFCTENGIIHVTRNNRINAKAGNINNALKQATGDICLILDPDHVPKEYFLDEIVPYFEDENIGFVQSVQAYYNVEESLVAKGAAEQTFHFYGPVMMTMNSYGTVNAIGANCVFRRKALDSIGGHAPGLSEDMHTAMQLYAKGWKSVYVPIVFTKGLVPATLTSYYKQQLKWSRGTLELLVSVYPKLFSDLTWRQRIHFGILPLHYLSGFIILISLLIPIISLFAAAMPWKGNIINFGLIFIPILASIVGIRFYVQRWVMDKSEWGTHLMGGLLLACTWWIYIIGAFYTIIRKKVPYLPTPKEDNERTSWKILVPNIIVGVISVVAVIYGLSYDFTPFSVFMSGFALINAAIMFFTLRLAYEKQKPIRMQRLIEDLLVFSRLNSSERTFETVDLGVIIEEVLASFSDVIKEKEAKIELQEMCEADIIVFQFRQLMHNLISNALKFSKPGENPNIKIKSSIVKGSELKSKDLSPDQKYCHVSISDNGIGFDEKFNEKIFEVFQKLHSKDEYPGTGIGLATVKKIVGHHNGFIFVESALNKGTTFDIYLPAETQKKSEK